MKPIKLIQAALALLMASSAAQAQNYPCIDYRRINNAYEYRFDLYIGELIFRDGIIYPEKTLTPEETD